MSTQDLAVYARRVEDDIVVSIMVLFVGVCINRNVLFLSENYVLLLGRSAV